ncbi:MAG: DUF2924 domain-containing protein [Pseudomonadota bacterium]
MTYDWETEGFPRVDLEKFRDPSLAKLDKMYGDDLDALWREHIHPSGLERMYASLMRKCVAFAIQSAAGPQPRPETLADLERLANGNTSRAAAARAASPGAVLVREWQGKTYRVDVTEDGFVLDGETYRSLSAVAKHITGAHWSGPRFFGLSKHPETNTQ